MCDINCDTLSTSFQVLDINVFELAELSTVLMCETLNILEFFPHFWTLETYIIGTIWNELP